MKNNQIIKINDLAKSSATEKDFFYELVLSRDHKKHLNTFKILYETIELLKLSASIPCSYFFSMMSTNLN